MATTPSSSTTTTTTTRGVIATLHGEDELHELHGHPKRRSISISLVAYRKLAHLSSLIHRADLSDALEWLFDHPADTLSLLTPTKKPPLKEKDIKEKEKEKEKEKGMKEKEIVQVEAKEGGKQEGEGRGGERIEGDIVSPINPPLISPPPNITTTTTTSSSSTSEKNEDNGHMMGSSKEKVKYSRGGGGGGGGGGISSSLKEEELHDQKGGHEKDRSASVKTSSYKSKPSQLGKSRSFGATKSSNVHAHHGGGGGGGHESTDHKPRPRRHSLGSLVTHPNNNNNNNSPSRLSIPPSPPPPPPPPSSLPPPQFMYANASGAFGHGPYMHDHQNVYMWAQPNIISNRGGVYSSYSYTPQSLVQNEPGLIPPPHSPTSPPQLVLYSPTLPPSLPYPSPYHEYNVARM